MSFKENLLKKITIDNLARRIIGSFGPPDSGQKIDREAMQSLLEMGPYAYQKKRDLDLYIKQGDDEKSKILVLDNELPIYRTTIEDVAIRKSPYISEMVKIGNIIKILKDSDVKLSRKEESVKTVQEECIDLLDLSYTEADIQQIADEGSAALENKYAEGIKECLALFAELLGYQPPPKAFHIRHHEIVGALSEKEAGELLYGPMVIFSLIDNSLKLMRDPISNFDKSQFEFFQQVIQGTQKADLGGPDVFAYLKQEALAQKQT
jgi:hypothetical protein